jgi:hypothetical protein
MRLICGCITSHGRLKGCDLVRLYKVSSEGLIEVQLLQELASLLEFASSDGHVVLMIFADELTDVMFERYISVNGQVECLESCIFNFLPSQGSRLRFRKSHLLPIRESEQIHSPIGCHAPVHQVVNNLELQHGRNLVPR